MSFCFSSLREIRPSFHLLSLREATSEAFFEMSAFSSRITLRFLSFRLCWDTFFALTSFCEGAADVICCPRA